MLSVTREVQLRSGSTNAVYPELQLLGSGRFCWRSPFARAQNLVAASCPDARDTTVLSWAFPNNLPMDTMLAGLLGRHKQANEVQKS